MMAGSVKRKIRKCSKSPLTFQIKGKRKVKERATLKARSAQEERQQSVLWKAAKLQSTALKLNILSRKTSRYILPV